jgi:tight adherence protein B
MMSDLALIFTLMFLAATLAVYGAYWILVFNRHEQKVLNRRLELSRQIANPSLVLERLHRERGFRNDLTNPLSRRVSDWLLQTGKRFVWKTVSLIALVCVLAFTLLFSLVFGVGLASIALAVLTTAAALVLYAARERSKRIFVFGTQLPDAIDIIVRGVRVGLPFLTAVNLVAREMPDPVGTEFGMLADEITFGLDVRSALDNLYRRVGQDDLLFFTVSVSVQAQTGGNLGEILTRLSRLMRNREKMRLKIRALSAEGRATAYALSAFPFVLFIVINLISPTYYRAIWSNPIVEPAIYLGFFLLIVGNVIIYRMVNFKI